LVGQEPILSFVVRGASKRLGKERVVMELRPTKKSPEGISENMEENKKISSAKPFYQRNFFQKMYILAIDPLLAGVKWGLVSLGFEICWRLFRVVRRKTLTAK